MTGPYHSIASMDLILKDYYFFQRSVLKINRNFLKNFKDFLKYTFLINLIFALMSIVKIKANDDRAILYNPRSNLGGSVVCHLGEVHLGDLAKGNIIDALETDL